MTTTDLSPPGGPAPAGDLADDKLDRGVLQVAGVVVLGVVMVILDTTVVSVALQELMLYFTTDFATIQWTVTGYMLALATVIPVTGWASDRFGTKRLFLIAIAAFVAGSVLAGAAWDVESLIAFRVLQGFGGGMLMPAGMTILTKAAGPHRVGRVMAVLGVPMLLGPISGPILGGWLVDDYSWRWIFYINLPVGLIALLLAWRVLPKDDPQPSEKFDFPGMLMLSPGLAALIFGLSRIPAEGGVGAVSVLVPGLAGIALIAGFVLRAMRIANPLVDLSLFRDRTFTVAVITMAFFSIAFFGAMLLFPNYFQLVREQSALETGLLLIPQGLGAMLTMPVAGRLTDKIGPGKIVLPGLVLIFAGMLMFTRIEADTPYWQLLAALFVLGLGMGATMMPIMSAALATLKMHQVARASTAMNIVQQTAGAIGSAIMSIVLAGLLATKFGVATKDSQIAATMAMKNPQTHDAAAVMAADSFASTFIWAVVLIALCLIPALLLPRTAAEPPADAGELGERDKDAPPVLVH
ncbi:MAG: DHA2 family efflux MFS transporter permease subunit [Thermocrispum sp.]